MKIYISHASSFDYHNELYIPLKQSHLFTQHKFILPHDISSAPLNTKEKIATCDLVIAEVSYLSTGQGIELGWADSFNIPIYCIHQSDKKYSSSLKCITRNIFMYHDEMEMLQILGSFLNLV